MTSSGTFSKLALIFTIGLLIQTHTADAGLVPEVQSTQSEVKHFLSTICSNVNSEPALLCSKTIDFFATKVIDEGTSVTEQFCELSAASLKLQFSTFNIDNVLVKTVAQKYLDSFKDNCKNSTKGITTSLIDHVSNPLKKTCADELEKSLPKGKSGDQLSLCTGVSSSAKNVCSNIVNKGCEAIGKEQPQWSSLVPACKENLSSVVCGEFLTAVESVVGKEQNNVASNSVETSSWIKRLFEHLAEGQANFNLSPFHV